MYIIFNSESQAIERNEQVASDCNFSGTTNNYANLIQHPAEYKFALIIASGFEQYFSQEEIDNSTELTADWKPVSLVL